MDTGPPRILLAANRRRRRGQRRPCPPSPRHRLYPYAMEPCVDDQQWLMRVAAGIVVQGTAAIAVLILWSSQ